jgi:membrane-bound lytic murein transglycosylase D
MMRATHDIRFQLGQKDRFLVDLVRSGRYLEEMKKVIREEGVPEDLAFLPHVESSFDYRAYSKVGAAGIWQFMRSTGHAFMIINYIMDERLDPLVATRAAARLLKANYDALGTWPLAITAYNYGRYGLMRIARKLGTNDIETIIAKYRRGAFGFASRNFYVQFTVTRRLAKDYKTYIGNVETEKPLSIGTFVLPKYLHAQRVADALNISLEELKSYNPAVRPPVWRGEKLLPKGFELRFPSQLNAQAMLASLIGNQSGSETQIATTWHRVAPGENLDSVAKKYATSPDRIRVMNDLSKHGRLLPGQMIQVPPLPDGVKPVAQATPPDTLPGPLVLEGATITAQGDTSREDDADEDDDEEELSAAPAAPVGVEESELRDMSARVSGLATIKQREEKNQFEAQIRVESDENVFLYAEWARVPENAILKSNPGFHANKLLVGRLLWIPLESAKAVQDFETKRLEYHRGIEEDFFSSYRVVDLKQHKVRRGEQIWDLCYGRYNIPMWLLYRLNTSVDFSKQLVGKVLRIPVIRRATSRIPSAAGSPSKHGQSSSALRAP